MKDASFVDEELPKETIPAAVAGIQKAFNSAKWRNGSQQKNTY